MRYVFSFGLALALGLMLSVGCGGAECESAADCDDQSVCTVDHCYSGVCKYAPLYNPPLIVPCELDGTSGFCIGSECKENPCVRGDSCIDEAPRYSDGVCITTRMDPDGTPCEANGVVGVCINGGYDDMGCHADNPCEGVVCEGDLLCTNNDTSRYVYYCDYADGVCKERAEACNDGNFCTYDRCDPETGDCFYPLVPDGVPWQPFPPAEVCCNGVLCPHDGNECTSDACNLETRSCVYMPEPDGTSCCFKWDPCPGFCFDPPCICCVTRGQCENGTCVD